MKAFSYSRPATLEAAVHAPPYSRYLAGGTNLIDLMKADVEQPEHVINIKALPLGDIRPLPGGGLGLGALATNACTAAHPLVRAHYPLLASAILAGGSPQIRNVATNGGNINQRTRCHYFYDTGMMCNKREPGAGCSAVGARSRMHAILGTSPDCMAVFPSDMCVALAVLDARINLFGPDGARQVPLRQYHCLPGRTPWVENVLRRNELVVGIELPPVPFGDHHTYLKISDPHAFAFSIISVAVGLEMEGDTIRHGRVALGGVATRPWYVPEVEEMLCDRLPSDALFHEVAGRLLQGALADKGNNEKLAIAPRVIQRALWQAVTASPQSTIMGVPAFS
ncbi:xanthine dehydrogenase family protein subunit M [Komagataeibacter sp. FNDCF1]|uniref:FAD binding domain-containing protein n=1 Tax=Komagataeibacter sp. FNDCF1 TaxID=2878681 RepID=UPI001E61758B|nr:FAD binding domain-containing protein [Komagataeibacter sp. FNDCF1]MCE2563215.1 FAD binding domain-containing protein [Komagataeibacter sp. FNDCF1]